MAEQKRVTYKGKVYRLLWKGQTKFGERCKLAFLDGSKEFWADASLVSDQTTAAVSQPVKRQAGRTCAECGKAGHLVTDLEDGLLKHYRCCDIPPG
jgi:hypothetical protein